MNIFVLSPTGQLAIYCGFVLLASLAGGWLLLALRLTHARLQMAGSFVAGLMLSMALLHFVPHAARENHSVDQTVRWVLGGFLAMFLLQRFFPHHHHDVSKGAPERRGAAAEAGPWPTLAFCAGTFLCIAAAGLLPEAQYHSHDRGKLSLALAAGVAVAVLVGWLEPSSRLPPLEAPAALSQSIAGEGRAGAGGGNLRVALRAPTSRIGRLGGSE